MYTKYLLLKLIFTGLALLLLGSSCAASSSQRLSDTPLEQSASDVIISVDGNNFLPDITQSIRREYKEGMTIKEILSNTGIIQFTADGKRIQSVGEISLDRSLNWAVKVNGNTVDVCWLNNRLYPKDNIVLYVESAKLLLKSPESVGRSSIKVSVSGGVIYPELRDQYACLFMPGVTTVREVLQATGVVQIKDNYRYNVHYREVGALQPNQRWAIFLNDKELAYTGLEMRLNRDDRVKLELVFVIR